MAEAELSEPMKWLQEQLYKRGPLRDTGSPQQQGLRVGALNANSIIGWSHCKQVQALIKDKRFDIFAIIETKLRKRDYKRQFHLDGYSYVRKDRRFAKKQKSSISKLRTTKIPAELNSEVGGGILIYIHESVNYKVKSRGEYAESNVEFLHIEITSPVQLHLVALYCPNKILVDHLISLMSYFMDPLGNRKIMFIGDTNIDRYGIQPQDYLGNTFFEVLKKKYEVNQLISEATHIFTSVQKIESKGMCAQNSIHNESCIDHIFTNLTVLEGGVMENCVNSTLSDYHQGIYCTLRVLVPYWVLENELCRLWRKTQGDTCTLAIFCKFQTANERPQVNRSVLQSSNDKEWVYYIEFNDTKTIEKQVSLLEPVIDKKKNIQRWTIFSHTTTSKLYKKLNGNMNNRLGKLKREAYTQETAGNTSYDAEDLSVNVQTFMNKLVPSLNRCTLAVFYQFPRNGHTPNITPADNAVKRHRLGRELVCYIMVDDVGEVNNKIQSIEDYTERINKADDSATHKQCIIFTRNSRSPVFDALQKKMWYKDWDFVWQPRHVEFLGYVLEPSLTYAFHITDRDPVWNIPNPEGEAERKEAIALQERAYRYWSTNFRYIERM